MEKEYMERLKNTLCRALENASSEQLTSSSLDNIFKLTGALHWIEEMGSGGQDGYSLDDGSYARGRGRYAKRDSMGRYANDGYANDGYANDGYANDGYSREGGGYSNDAQSVARALKAMMEGVDNKTRQALQKAVKEMESK